MKTITKVIDTDGTMLDCTFGCYTADNKIYYEVFKTLNAGSKQQAQLVARVLEDHLLVDSATGIAYADSTLFICRSSDTILEDTKINAEIARLTKAQGTNVYKEEVPVIDNKIIEVMQEFEM